MAIRKIVTEGAAVLRKQAVAIPRSELGKPALRQLVSDMVETMQAAKGVGLAAPQVGESIRLFVANTPGGDVALVNPAIVRRSRQTQTDEEGCLSIPGKHVQVERAFSVTVEALTIDGEGLHFTAEGLLARIIQHEYDHLEGTLIIDHVKKPAKGRG